MAPDQADVDEAIRLAKTIGSMTVYQKTKLQKERITGPATPVEELIEKGGNWSVRNTDHCESS